MPVSQHPAARIAKKNRGSSVRDKLFHDWLHHQIDNKDGTWTIKNTGETVKLTTREFCYQLLNRYRSDKARLHELINEDF